MHWLRSPPKSTPPPKHTHTHQRHRTSVYIEPELLDAFRTIAAEKDTPLNALAAEIDAARRGEEGLASAIRVFCLNHYRRP